MTPGPPLPLHVPGAGAEGEEHRRGSETGGESPAPGPGAAADPGERGQEEPAGRPALPPGPRSLSFPRVNQCGPYFRFPSPQVPHLPSLFSSYGPPVTSAVHTATFFSQPLVKWSSGLRLVVNGETGTQRLKNLQLVTIDPEFISCPGSRSNSLSRPSFFPTCLPGREQDRPLPAA